MALRQPNAQGRAANDLPHVSRGPPPDRLVVTEIFEPYPDVESVVTTELAEENGQTRLTSTIQYQSLVDRDMVLASGMERGAAISCDRLEEMATELERA